MTLRSLPTGGNPIPPRAAFNALWPSATEWDFLSRLFPGKQAFPVGSGSAGLRLALEAMKACSERREVILPGYTCPSVLATVINAGLIPVLCDLAPNSFQLSLSDLKRKTGPRTLAVIVVHLYGLPDRIASIREITDLQNAWVVEDAAQALGSAIDGSGRFQTGDLGDLAVFSFGQGKPFSLLSGGAVIANNPDLTNALSKISDTLPQTSGPAKAVQAIKLGAYSFLFHPRLFWIPQSLPFLHIGETVFRFDLNYTKMQPLTFRLGQLMIDQVKSFRVFREHLANLYINQLKDIAHRFAFFPSQDPQVHLLRFPLIFKSHRERAACLAALSKARLGASRSYPYPLDEFKPAQGYLSNKDRLINARDTARKVMTLPLHMYVRKGDISIIGKIFREALIG
jgi:dTDP-4-amino-4,6-dideoxygalactose transaminase